MIIGPNGHPLYAGKAADAANAFRLLQPSAPSSLPALSSANATDGSVFNPADFVLDRIFSMSSAERQQLREQCSRQAVSILRQGEELARFDGEIQREAEMRRELAETQASSIGCCCILPASVRQCGLLFGRANRQLFRSRVLLSLTYGVPIVVGFAFGGVYKGITFDLQGIQVCVPLYTMSMCASICLQFRCSHTNSLSFLPILLLPLVKELGRSFFFSPSLLVSGGHDCSRCLER